MVLKTAFNAGIAAAFEKLALSTGLKQQAMGAALGRRGLQMPSSTAGPPITSEALHAARTGRLVAGGPTEQAIKGVTGGVSPAALPPKALVDSGLAQNAPGAMNAIKRFGHGQLAHGSNLIHGLGNIGSTAGRGLALNSAKGLLPSLAAAGGAYLLSRGGDDQPQQQPMPQRYPGY